MPAQRRTRGWTLAQKVAFLRSREAYALRMPRIRAIETHFAWVFLTPHLAYKLKKPVRQGMMDYRSLAARAFGCREELRLNRRLAATVYRAVVPLSSRRGALVLGKGEQVEDWLVKMTRLSASGMLDSTLKRRALREVEFARVTATLSRFFRRAQAAPMHPDAYLRRLRHRIAQNQRELLRPGTRVPRRRVTVIVQAQRRYLARARARLAERARCIVEGHGDLRAEHLHLGPPVRVIDCIEFSHDLRCVDPAEEIAFLSLEIERLGHPQWAARCLRCADLCGKGVVEPSIMAFYASYTALTRARIAILHLRDPQYPVARPWVTLTNSYLRDAGRQIALALAQLPQSSTHMAPSKRAQSRVRARSLRT